MKKTTMVVISGVATVLITVAIALGLNVVGVSLMDIVRAEGGISSTLAFPHYAYAQLVGVFLLLWGFLYWAIKKAHTGKEDS